MKKIQPFIIILYNTCPKHHLNNFQPAILIVLYKKSHLIKINRSMEISSLTFFYLCSNNKVSHRHNYTFIKVQSKTVNNYTVRKKKISCNKKLNYPLNYHLKNSQIYIFSADKIFINSLKIKRQYYL